MEEDSVYKMISRIKHSEEGLDFIEYLKKLSLDNYEEFKLSDSRCNDVCKGVAIAYDNLIKLFEKCDDKLKQREAIATEGFY